MSKTLRPKMELAVELFPLPVFPSRTSLFSVEEESCFLPDKREKNYIIYINKRKQASKQETNINPNIPEQPMTDSCLLMDDMLFLVTCLHKVRT